MKRKAIYKRLVRRYLDNKATDPEREVFFHLLAIGKLDPFLQAAMRADAHAALAGRPGARIWLFSLRVAVAAVIIGIAVLSAILWMRPDKAPAAHPTLSFFKNEVYPGGNHAVLTLAGGARIVLDSAEKGSLGMQGGSRIVKVGAGSLSYEGVSGAAGEGSGAAGGASAGAVYYNTVATPAGGQYQITLADGTRVWLNSLSSLQFPTSFHGQTRTVVLIGEAYFEVAEDKSRPFHVQSGGMEVQVLGTHFNINAYADEQSLTTTLLQGRVRLMKGKTALILSPGEQGQATSGTEGLSLVKDADVDDAVAWKNGNFSFDDANIEAVMRQLARWYGISVKYKGSPTRALFWGKMGRDLNLTQVLTGLSKSKVHFQLEGTTLTVLP